MKKLNELRLFISIFLASTLISIGFFMKGKMNYELNNLLIVITILIISFISYIIPRIIFSNIVKIKEIRKMIYGKNFLEGYWHLKVISSSTNNFNKQGLAEISFNNSKPAFQIIVSRLNDNSELFTTNSKDIVMLDDETKIVNIFSLIHIEDSSKIEGISSGHFIHSSANTLIDRYHGMIFTYNSNEAVKQDGYRIPEENVKYFKQKYHQNWKEEYLKRDGNI